MEKKQYENDFKVMLVELLESGRTAKELSEDLRHDAEHEVQKYTDEHIKRIDEIIKHKEAEIMEV